MVVKSGLKTIILPIGWNINEIWPEKLINEGTLKVTDGVLTADLSDGNGYDDHMSRKLPGKLVIDDSVTSIGNSAFTNMAWVIGTNFSEVIIPNSVTNIGSGTFSDCPNLTSIYYSGSATGAKWGSNATIKPYSEAPAELLP